MVLVGSLGRKVSRKVGITALLLLGSLIVDDSFLVWCASRKISVLLPRRLYRGLVFVGPVWIVRPTLPLRTPRRPSLLSALCTRPQETGGRRRTCRETRPKVEGPTPLGKFINRNTVEDFPLSSLSPSLLLFWAQRVNFQLIRLIQINSRGLCYVTCLLHGRGVKETKSKI